MSAGVAGEFALAVLKAIVVSEDKLTEIASQIKSLKASDLNAGIRILATIDSLPRRPGDDEHIQHRYRDALRHFDTAFENAPDESKPFVRLVMAAVCLRLRGASAEAGAYLAEFARESRATATRIATQIRPLLAQADAWSQEAAQIRTSADPYAAGTGLVMWEDTNKALRRNDLIRRALINRTKAEELDTSVAMLNDAATAALEIETAVANTHDPGA